MQRVIPDQISFSPSCSDQVPAYIKRYDEYKAKGVQEIYVVSINDMFVMQAWRKKLLSESDKEGQEKSTVKFGMSPAFQCSGSHRLTT